MQGGTVSPWRRLFEWTDEEIVGFPFPQITEERVEVAVVPQRQEQSVEVFMAIVQERVSERIVEQIVVVPQEIVGIARLIAFVDL